MKKKWTLGPKKLNDNTSKKIIKWLIGLFTALFLIVLIFYDGCTEYLFEIEKNQSYPRFELAKLLVQTTGGFVILISFLATIRRLSISERNLLINSETLRLSRESLNVEKQKAAIETLASNAPEIRIAGYYSLIRIAKSDKSECENILDILATFIRNKTSTNQLESDEVQILLNLLLRRENKELFTDYQINFEGVKLSRLNLIKSQLHKASFNNSVLDNIYLEDSDFSLGFLTNSTVIGVKFDRSDLSDLMVSGTIFEACSFMEADLTGVYFNDCSLTLCNFVGATGINERTFLHTKLIKNCHGVP